MTTEIDLDSYTRINVLVKQNRSGTFPFGPVAVPVGITEVGIALDNIDHINPARRWDVLADFSNDGGATWNPYPPWPQGCGRPGGETRDHNNVVQPEAFILRALPEPENALRRIRGTLTTNGNINLRVDLLVK